MDPLGRLDVDLCQGVVAPARAHRLHIEWSYCVGGERKSTLAGKVSYNAHVTKLYAFLNKNMLFLTAFFVERPFPWLLHVTVE